MQKSPNSPIKSRILSLKNGLRIVLERSNSQVVYCGYVVCAGTRHEAETDFGMAHFIEHMAFKGTARRSSVQIGSFLENVGGDLNAFTNKQETVYTATVLKKDTARAIDLLTDIVFHSTFPQSEITKEVEVIVDEIDSYRDTPSELIFDEFEQMLFGGTPLGRDILGSPERLREYTTADARRFADAHYRPENCVFYLYGDVDFERALRTLEKAHQSSRTDTAKTEKGNLGKADFTAENNDFTTKNDGFIAKSDTPKPRISTHLQETETANLRIVKKGTHQAHVMVGARTFGSHDSRRFALLLLNNILGGPGMNSRLNIEVREKRGLVYGIDSYLNAYPDTGYWNVYFGCDEIDIKRCLKLVRRELDKLISTPLSPTRLKMAKAQLCGQIGISADNHEAHALALGKTFAHTGKIHDFTAIMDGVSEVTAEDLQTLAAEIYAPENIFTLIYR